MANDDILDNILDKIQSNVEDNVFNNQNRKRADKEEYSLFGSDAKKSFHIVSAWSVKILGFVILFIMVFILLIRGWHLLMPEKWQWLTGEATNKIDHILLGIFAGISARFFPVNKSTEDKE